MLFDRWRHRISMGVRSLFQGRALDTELDEELQWHLDHQIDANIAAGMAPVEARRAALVAMGGLQQRKEECRDRRRTRLVEQCAQDVRYALRSLSQAPTFSLAAIGTLTLGIGASVAMFSVVNGVLIRELPLPQPDRLFLVAMSPRTTFLSEPVLADHNYVALRDHDHGFSRLATFSTFDGSLVGAGDPVIVKAGRVTTEFFDVLGVAPALGRTFDEGDAAAGAEPTVVLSEAIWRTRYGSDRSVVGRRLTLDGVTRVVIGVMPAGFDFPSRVGAWTPQAIALAQGNSFMFPVIARLKPDVTVEQARARFDSIRRQLPLQPDAEATSPWTIGLVPLKELLVGSVRRPLTLFSAAVMVVLLIACANVAHLLLTRASHRRREIAVRVALGATRARLVRQVLTESLVLALLGGAAGVLLAQWSVPALLALAPQGRIPRVEMIRLDGWVVAFAGAASVATALACGLIPALGMTRGRGSEPLMPGSRTFGGGHDRLRRTLVVGEIAVALVLLTGAGLLLKSFLRLSAVDPGFDPRHVITLNLDLPAATYPDAPRLRVFHQQLLERLRAVPGVASVGLVNWRPLGTMHINGDFQAEGASLAPDLTVDKPAVSGGYFAAMGIRLTRGREFDSRDTTEGAPVAIVSRSVARQLDPDEDVLGRRVTLQSTPRPQDWLTIVGVVDDVRQWGPSQPARPAIYKPFQQVNQPFFLSHMSYALRTASDPGRIVPAIRTALGATDRNQAPTSIVAMEDVLFTATADPRFQTRLLGIFALLALALAIVGIYGVLAYSVAQRTHEIGVRMALGARPGSVIWMVLRRTLWLGLAGVVIGTAGAAATTRLLGPFLFETPPTDPGTFVGVAAAMLAAALAAGAFPARRATRIDPLVALRHE